MSEFLKINDLNLGCLDATNYKKADNVEVFKKFFLADEKLNTLLEPQRYYIVGDKGTGKTAYAVYLEQIGSRDCKAKIISLLDTDYMKFIHLKEGKNLNFSEYKDVWEVILLLLLSDLIKNNEKDNLLASKFDKINEAINAFYNHAFSPEIDYALQFAEDSNLSAKLIFDKFQVAASDGIKCEFTETRFQMHLLYIKKKFEEALNTLTIKNKYILLIDGIDIRPNSVSYEEYIQCINGLATAIWQLNTAILSGIGISDRTKIMALIRPDIFDKMGLQNLNNRLRDNSILFDWKTGYKDFEKSGLFKIVDKLLRSQQKNPENISEGEAWNYYFPYKCYNYYTRDKSDSSFIPFLRYSFARPRDILSLLDIMKINASDGQSVFTESDFRNPSVQRQFSDYLLGEIRDSLSFYYPSSDFDLFTKFFYHLYPYLNRGEFEYDSFLEAYNNFYREDVIKIEGENISSIYKEPNTFLQLIFELNIIAYIVKGQYKSLVKWYYRERSYGNIRPRVHMKTRYRMHQGIASALTVKMNH